MFQLKMDAILYLNHGFYPEYPFMKILDIDLYEDKKQVKLFFRISVHLKYLIMILF